MIVIVGALIALVLLSMILGMLLFPAALFIRASRSKAWDDSNVINMYRVVFHLMIHPADFGRMRFEDGKRPFWYIDKDEYSEVVQSRPTKEDNNE